MGIIDKIEEKLGGHSKTDKTADDHLAHNTNANTTSSGYGDQTGSTQNHVGSGITGTTGTSVSGASEHQHKLDLAHHNIPVHGGTAPGNPPAGLAATGHTSLPEQSTTHGHHGHHGTSEAAGTGLAGGVATHEIGKHGGHSTQGSYVPTTTSQTEPLVGHHDHHHQGGVTQAAGAGVAGGAIGHEVRKHEHGSGPASDSIHEPSSAPFQTFHAQHGHGGDDVPSSMAPQGAYNSSTTGSTLNTGHQQGGLTRAAEGGVAGGLIGHEVGKHEHHGQTGMTGSTVGQQGLQSQSGAGYSSAPGQAYDSTATTGQTYGSSSTTGIGNNQSTSQTGPMASVKNAASSVAGAVTGNNTSNTNTNTNTSGHNDERSSTHHDQAHEKVDFRPNLENPSAIPTAGGEKIGAGEVGSGGVGSSAATNEANTGSARQGVAGQSQGLAQHGTTTDAPGQAHGGSQAY